MDPDIQPSVLSILTQVEQFSFVMSTQFLQVTHSHGGQYKYYVHTISFPQDISNIATSLPHLISYLDILVFHKINPRNNPYELFISQAHVLSTIKYNFSNDPYYKDVSFNPIALSYSSLESTYISPIIHHSNPHDTTFHKRISPSIMQLLNSLEPRELQSLFISTQENYTTEVEEIGCFLRI